MSATVFDGWLGTRRDRITAALVLSWFAILNGLVLLGYEGALALLAASVGLLLIGALLAHLGASAVRQRFALLFGAWRGTAAVVVAFVLMLAVLFLGGAYATDSPSLLSAENGPSGPLVYGLALGFGISIRHRLAPPRESTPEEDRENTRAGLRLLFVVGGAAAGLFALTFAVYAAVEYVVGPAIRLLAP